MKIPISITVNGRLHEREVEPRLLLVHLLRDVLGLTGTKIGCDTSQCGSCTVLVDGVAVKSCTCLAAQADGASVTTIEGLGGRHALQDAFVVEGGAQCGICTPGMILAAAALPRGASLPEIRVGLAGNICRCTGYTAIYRAVRKAQRKRPPRRRRI